MSARADKDARARFGQCWDKAVLHVRVGQGRQDGTSVELVGLAADLHGPNGCCTCCKRAATVAPMPVPQADDWTTFTTALRLAADDAGEVHQSAMRDLIHGRIEPHLIGRCYSRARREGLLTEVRREPSDDVRGRNTNKWEPVYRLEPLARAG